MKSENEQIDTNWYSLQDFVVTSCNADFNDARLERYLALAKEAEVFPVVLLTRERTGLRCTRRDFKRGARC